MDEISRMCSVLVKVKMIDADDLKGRENDKMGSKIRCDDMESNVMTWRSGPKKTCEMLISG